jgi:hypothetical protein
VTSPTERMLAWVASVRRHLRDGPIVQVSTKRFVTATRLDRAEYYLALRLFRATANLG